VRTLGFHIPLQIFLADLTAAVRVGQVLKLICHFSAKRLDGMIGEWGSADMGRVFEP